MKKLPNVFRNNLTKKSDNNNSIYYSFEDVKNSNTETLKGKNVLQKIDTIFKSSNYIYKMDVEITLKDSVVKKRIIGRNKTHLITINNELISISDILDIKKSLN